MKTVYIIERDCYSEAEQKNVSDFFCEYKGAMFFFSKDASRAMTFDTRKNAVEYRAALLRKMVGAPTLKVVAHTE